MDQALLVALLIALLELGVRVGMSLATSRAHERRITHTETDVDRIYNAIRELRDLILTRRPS